MIVAIDPGKHKIAYAMGDKSMLLEAGLIPFTNHNCLAASIAMLTFNYGFTNVKYVIECPRVYKSSPARPNDIIDLALVTGTLLSLYNSSIVYPHEWKGQQTKKINHGRIMEKLTGKELSKIPKNRIGNIDHNIMDAIGIYLFIRSKNEN